MNERREKHARGRPKKSSKPPVGEAALLAGIAYLEEEIDFLLECSGKSGFGKLAKPQKSKLSLRNFALGPKNLKSSPPMRYLFLFPIITLSATALAMGSRPPTPTNVDPLCGRKINETVIDDEENYVLDFAVAAQIGMITPVPGAKSSPYGGTIGGGPAYFVREDFNSPAKAHFAPRYATTKRIPLHQVDCVPLREDSFSKAELPGKVRVLYPIFGQHYTVIQCGHLRERTAEEMRRDFCGVSSGCLYSSSNPGDREAIEAIRKTYCSGDVSAAFGTAPTSGGEVNDSHRNPLHGKTTRDRPVYPSSRVGSSRASRQ